MHPLRDHREDAGLTQADLAARAGVSRQLVSAVEAGRHQPRVDAALALARALGVDVATLFGRREQPVDVLTGAPPTPGSVVRTGRVGDLAVVARARVGEDGFEVADAVVGEDGRLEELAGLRPGPVVAGCEPGLVVLEGLLRQAGRGAVGVPAGSAAAAAALAAGRVHAAVVHGPLGRTLPVPPAGTVRRGLATWRTGLAAPTDLARGWWRDALAGRLEVVEREPGAGVQRELERARTAAPGRGPAPVVATHLAAARTAVARGSAGVTIEPAALAVGAAFHPLSVHVAELWVAGDHVDDPGVQELLGLLASRSFRRRLDAVGGYDLSACGTAVAA